MAAPVGPPQTPSSEPKPVPSNIDLAAPPMSIHDIAAQIDARLKAEAGPGPTVSADGVVESMAQPQLRPAPPAPTPAPLRPPATYANPHPPVVAAVAPVPPTEPVVPPEAPAAPQADPNDQGALPPEEPPPEAAEGEQPPDDGGIHTVAQLAAHHGVQESELLDVIHITTEDGNQIPLSTVVTGYLSQPEAEQAAQERALLETQFEQRRAELESVQDQALLRVGHLAKIMQDDLIGAMPSAEEMGRLKVEDTERYNEIRLRSMEMQQRVQQAIGFLDQEYGERIQKEEERLKNWRETEAKKVMKIFPDLANPATAKQQDLAISSYLGGIGFTAEEIAGLHDSRLYRVLRDAMYGSKVRKMGQAKLAEARDRGLPTPKPGPRARVEPPGPNQQKEQQIAALVARQKQTGSVDDTAAILRARGIA